MAANLRDLVHNRELINQVEQEYGPHISVFGFYKYYLNFKSEFQGYVEDTEETYAWMNELLAECRETFKTHELHLIPKTPTVKQRKRKGRAARTDSEDNDSVPQKKNRSTRRRKGKGDSGVSSLADDNEEEEQNTGSGRVTRQTRVSAKATQGSQRSTRGKKGEQTEEVENTDEDNVKEPISKLKFVLPEPEEVKSSLAALSSEDESGPSCIVTESTPLRKDITSPARKISESKYNIADGATKGAPSDVEMVSSSDEQHVVLEAPSEDDELDMIPDSPATRKQDTSQSLRQGTTDKRTSLQKQVQRLSTINKSKSRQRSSMFRHQLRRSMQMAVQIAKEEAQEIKEDEIKAAEDDEIIAASPAPQAKRVTRSKIRQPKNAPTTDSDSCLSSKKSSAEDGDDEDDTRKVMPPPPRPSRSKMRNKVASHIAQELACTSSDDEPDQPVRNFRSTRSKMRSQTDTSDSQSSPSTPTRQKKGHMASALSQHLISPDSDASSAERYVKRFGKPVLNSSNLFKKTPVPNGSLNTIVSDFLKRNTPKKKATSREVAESKKQEMREKEKEAADRLRRQQEEQKKKFEEIKRQREERRRLVAQRREELNQLNQQAKADENKAAPKLQELKQREEREKQKLREKRQIEVEQRRKQEDEMRLRKLHEQEMEQRRKEEALQRQKEQEEMERQRRIAEQRKAEEMRRLEQERQRKEEAERIQKELLKKKQEEEHQRRLREEKERREKEERERQEIERQKERERQKMLQIEKEKELERQRLRETKERERREEEDRKASEMLKKHNGVLQNSMMNSSSKLNSTMTMDEPSVPNPPNATTIHEVHTNLPKPNAHMYTNYNIFTLNSDDSTDDESRPKKKIPKWAEGSELRIALVNQRFHPPDLDELFRDCMEDLDLSNVFSRVKPRFKNRTSSAIWNSPPMKPSGKYFT